MTDQSPQEGVVVLKPGETGEGEAREAPPAEAIQHPAKVMRIATMVRQLLEEVRHAGLDEASRSRMKDIYETSIHELSEVLSDDLKDELGRLSSPFDGDTPSDAELRVAHAQLVGWLEGLFHGIQAMLFAQQAESRARFEDLRRRSLPSGEDQPPQTPGQGTYL
jgi:Protein of unknown function (DUF2587)